MKKYKDRKGINLLTIFLVIDLLAVFASIKTSGAIYQAEAVGRVDLDVAYYAFKYDVVEENEEQVKNINIDLGDLEPNVEKKYKIRIYNSDGTKHADTHIIYDMRIITTTNLKLNYKLYFNQKPDSTGAVDLISTNQVVEAIQKDEWGTYFHSFIVPPQCIAYQKETYDYFYLTIEMPEEFALNHEYQDLIESIKIQIKSKQAMNNDIATLAASGITCHES